ncbi:MAG: hypothetical protein WCA39_08150 [Nitrososphaeraceae archaeon]|jgi:hypothetical protein
MFLHSNINLVRENQKAFSLAEEPEAYKNFIDSINSDTTRYEYAKNLRYFLSFCNLPRYKDLLLIDQPKLEVQIRDYIVPHIIDLNGNQKLGRFSRFKQFRTP